MTDNPPAEDLRVTRIIDAPNQKKVLQVRMAKLAVVKGPDQGQEVDIPPFGALVGSSPECHLVVTDSAVSRRHCEVVPAEHGFRLRDLESTNGTLVRGLRVRDLLLAVDEDIQVGHSHLRLTLLDQRGEYPLSSRSSFGQLLGRSLAMRQVFTTLERAAEAETIVLLEGESGTGKEVAAESIHQRSPRKAGPFVVVDCGALQPSLVESELFGHCKGAFTGAIADRMGAFEAAEGGTVFLDEIGELGKEVQPKLLRVLEKRAVRRVGENEYRSADFRLIAATNRDLKAEVAAERFREDLYFRLSVLKVRLPPLRERREDVGPLARSFVQSLRPDLDPQALITDHVINLLAAYDWPGNVRELRNVVERIILFPEKIAEVIDPDQSGSLIHAQDLLQQPLNEARRLLNDRFEQVYLSALLASCQGMVTRVAQKAGVPRQTIHRLMVKHGLGKSSDD